MKTKTVEAKEAVTQDRDHLLELLRQMILIRRYEEKCSELYQASKIRGFMHLYIGEEASAVGIMQALTPEDSVTCTYREHGQALARGVDGGEMMAEMYGKVEGSCRGRGGSMHIFDAKTRFFGGNAIVAGGIPLGVGIGLAEKMRNTKNVSCVFFGEGATPEGEFHESLNMAALWHLPVLFICENNLWCMGTSIKYHSSNPEIYQKAPTYGIPSERVDGMDVLAVEAATRKAVQHIRDGNGPYFLEVMTYRYRPHSMFDADTYRDKAEVEDWKKKDCIEKLQAYMGQEGWLSDTELDEIEKGVAAEVQRAVDFAEAGAWEPVEDLERFIYSERRPA
ncbi:MAG TPA: pyruvate dehydrogenase (acetyl-transferring) E1 component subunit alpha [Anaerolineales bacterium]